MGPLVLIEGKLNANGYNKLLAENLLPFINGLKEEDGNGIFTFQEDNAPCHKAATTHRWKEENNVIVLPWPPQSPDLNHIENLWQDLKRRHRLNNYKSKKLREEWFSTSPGRIIDSMPR